MSCARLALQSDGVVGTATCVARGAAVPATERLKQIAGAHTAAIRMLPLPPQSPGVWSMEPLAAMAADFPPSLKSEPDNRQQCFAQITVARCLEAATRQMPRSCLLTTHLLACGVRPLFSRSDKMRPYHMPVWRVSSWCLFASLLCRLRSDF